MTEEVWTSLDANGDGKVSAAEIAMRLRKVNLAHKEHSADTGMRDEDVQKRMDFPDEPDVGEFEDTDKDKDGNITEAELIQHTMETFKEGMEEGMDETMKKDEERELQIEVNREKALFKEADLDHDGQLTLQEFIYSRHKHFPELDEYFLDTDSDAQYHLEELDTDKDGSISAEEMRDGHGKIVHVTHPSHLRELLKDEM